MKSFKRFIPIFVFLSSLNSYSDSVKNFNELKNKFILGSSINGVLDIDRCRYTSTSSNVPSFNNQNGDRFLYSRFSESGGSLSVENDDGGVIESIVFVVNENVLPFQSVNSTELFSPISVISQIVVNNRHEVKLLYYTSINKEKGYRSAFQCDWSALTFKTIE